MPARKPAQVKAQVKAQKRQWYRVITRDLVLFIVGLLLFIYEATLKTGSPREFILLMEAGMMGLPTILGADERRQNIGEEE